MGAFGIFVLICGMVFHSTVSPTPLRDESRPGDLVLNDPYVVGSKAWYQTDQVRRNEFAPQKRQTKFWDLDYFDDSNKYRAERNANSLQLRLDRFWNAKDIDVRKELSQQVRQAYLFDIGKDDLKKGNSHFISHISRVLNLFLRNGSISS